MDAHTTLQKIDNVIATSAPYSLLVVPNIEELLFQYFQTQQNESLVQDEEQFDMIPEEQPPWAEHIHAIHADSFACMSWLVNKKITEYTEQEDTRFPFFDSWAKDGTQYAAIIRYQRRAS